MAKVKVLICPYCGEAQPAGERCRSCSGLFEPLSRQATHNAMGPWFIRDEQRPFQPGCSYETVARMIHGGRITKYTLLRGPTTKQFWQIAKRAAGVGHLLGYCHNCDTRVDPKDIACGQCGVAFGAYLERNHLGLPDVTPLPWDADEDSGASTGEFHEYFGPPRPQATGVSSFARDDEIVSGSDRLSPTGSFASSMGGSMTQAQSTGGQHETTDQQVSTSVAHRAEPESLGDVLQVQEAYTSSARQRSLERRLAQQKRMVHILAGLLVLALATALAFSFGLFGTNTGVQDSGGEVSIDDPAQPTSDDNVKTIEPGSGIVLAGDEPDSTEDFGEGLASSDIPEGTVDGAQEAGAAPDRSGPHEAEYARAQSLIQRAADKSLDFEDRVASMSEAVDVLRNIREVVDRQDWPVEDLDVEVARRTRQLERLKLSEFYD